MFLIVIVILSVRKHKFTAHNSQNCLLSHSKQAIVFIDTIVVYFKQFIIYENMFFKDYQ